MLIFGQDTDPAEVRRALDAGDHFWLDLPADRFTPDHPAAQALGFTAERRDRILRRQGRAVAIVADDHAAIIFAGATRADGHVDRMEVVVIAGGNALVTLRDRPCRTLDELRDAPHDIDALRVLDALTDSLLEVAEAMEEEVEDAENTILQRRSSVILRNITGLRQQVSDLLKITREQRGLIERNEEELWDIPVVFGDAERRVRDLRGHLARATDAAESTRTTIAEALNLYLSIAAENLTRIATVLLPLTVVSGFFGMNFTWMVDHIDSFWAFMVFGIGGMLASVAGVRLYLRRKGYA